MRGGASKMRVTTSSRSDFRSALVRLSLCFFSSIHLLLAFEFCDYLVQLVEARDPALAIRLDPGRLVVEAARPERARAHAPDLFRRDQPGLLQDGDVLLHARQRHVELLGEVGDRRIGTTELLENAASSRVRERGER